MKNMPSIRLNYFDVDEPKHEDTTCQGPLSFQTPHPRLVHDHFLSVAFSNCLRTAQNFPNMPAILPTMGLLR